MDRDIRGIVFKGNAEGLIIVIPEEYSFEQVKKEVGEKLNKATRFLVVPQ